MNIALIALALVAPQEFGDVSNRKEFLSRVRLAPEHRAALRSNQFFTCPSDHVDLHSIYAENDYQKLPSLITADNALQIFHIFFDSTLRTVEENNCLPDLEKLVDAMSSQCAQEVARDKGTTLESAANKNAAYFGVASRLLGKRPNLPATVSSLAEAEFKLVQGRSGYLDSAIFPYKLDYSQFIVRGHYTRSQALRRYFSAMMWLGLIPISVAKRAGNEVTPLPEQIRMASLMALNLGASGAEKYWNKIYNFTSLFAGASNRLTPSEWKAILTKTYSAGDVHRGLADDSTLTALAKNAMQARSPAYGTMVQEVAVAADVQMRFMGQRALPDGVMISRIVEPRKRPFPNPLDVLAILGSKRAETILDSNVQISNPLGWSEYKTKRSETRDWFAKLPATSWKQDLYWSWLDCLKIATKPMADKAPAMLKSSAWNDRRLNSALGSWAELRHDTLLYGEQTAVEMGDGDEPLPILRGYVEPDVALYERISAISKQLESGLKKFGYFASGYDSEFDSFNELLGFLLKVSKSELAGKSLPRADHDRIRKIEGLLGALNTRIQITGTKYNTLTKDDYDMALVSDVHTGYGKALTVAVGRADHLIAIIPIEGKKYFARGSVLSYHEWLQPIDQRMSDPQWKALLNKGQSKPRPSWVKSFFVNKPAPLIKK